MTPDLVLYLKEGSENEELRYAVRSWCRNLTFHKLWVVGGPMPKWFNPDYFISNPTAYPAIHQSYDNLVKITAETQLRDNIVVMMDDIFIMKPYGIWATNYNRGTLLEQIERSVKKNHGATTPYAKMVNDTELFLRSYLPSPRLSFEEHAPFACDKTTLHNVLLGLGAKNGAKVLWRSVYGNFCQIPSEYKPDVKVAERLDYWPKDAPIISTNERAFAGRVGVMLQERFSRRSKYER